MLQIEAALMGGFLVGGYYPQITKTDGNCAQYGRYVKYTYINNK
jgi:hypothetical protein